MAKQQVTERLAAQAGGGDADSSPDYARRSHGAPTPSEKKHRKAWKEVQKESST